MCELNECDLIPNFTRGCGGSDTQGWVEIVLLGWVYSFLSVCADTENTSVATEYCCNGVTGKSRPFPQLLANLMESKS